VKWWTLIAVAGVLLVPPSAQARDWGRGFSPRLQAQGQEAKPPPVPNERRERGKPGVPDKRHQGRLTEEQRRELHRDLDRANREIYRR
jgi:hypothetical protein